MPRVTVIIPTYNWSTVLPYSIRSVLAQTFTDFEVLVIGDACTDDSEQVVTSIGDPRVRWINLPARSGHQSGPNNEGLRQASGDVIAYLGHDDLWMPYHLQEVVAAIDAGADLVHSGAALVAPGSRGGRAEVSLADQRWRPPSCSAHRASVIAGAGPWRDFRHLHVPPEIDLWDRIGAAGYVVKTLRRVSAIKFPAGWRKDVYKDRPCEEQAHWARRIASEPEFEQTELTRLVRLSNVKRAMRLLKKPSQWLAFVWRRPGARIRAWQRYKGL